MLVGRSGFWVGLSAGGVLSSGSAAFLGCVDACGTALGVRTSAEDQSFGVVSNFSSNSIVKIATAIPSNKMCQAI